MGIHSAVIGPDDLVGSVLDLGGEFPSLDLRAWAYATEDEAPALFREASEQAELFIFTGPVPFYATRFTEKPQLPLLFVPLTGSSLLRTLFLLREHADADVTRLSIDSLRPEIVREVYHELGLCTDNVFTRHYTGPISAIDLVAFHEDLWHAGKISAAVSCLRSAYQRLIAMGIPAFRILPTNSAIRETLKLAVVEGERLRSVGTQIVVQICNIDGFSALIKRKSSEYEGERVRLALQHTLNDYAEQTWAAVFFLGRDEFSIFTTRGILESTTNYYQTDPLLDEIRRQLPVTVSIGTGLGRTAYHAERNARQALARAKAEGGDCSFVLTDDGRLLGPLGRPPRREATLSDPGGKLMAVATAAGMSVETVSKVDALLGVLGTDSLTVGDLARALQITTRSAHRILTRLAQAGFAEVAGKEQPLPSGRPHSVYRMRFGRSKG